MQKMHLGDEPKLVTYEICFAFGEWGVSVPKCKVRKLQTRLEAKHLNGRIVCNGNTASVESQVWNVVLEDCVLCIARDVGANVVEVHSRPDYQVVFAQAL